MDKPKEMTQKITLTLPASLIERAKIIGIKSGRSVSEMATEGLRPIVDALEKQFPGDSSKKPGE